MFILSKNSLKMPTKLISFILSIKLQLASTFLLFKIFNKKSQIPNDSAFFVLLKDPLQFLSIHWIIGEIDLDHPFPKLDQFAA